MFVFRKKFINYKFRAFHKIFLFYKSISDVFAQIFSNFSKNIPVLKIVHNFHEMFVFSFFEEFQKNLQFKKCSWFSKNVPDFQKMFSFSKFVYNFKNKSVSQKCSHSQNLFTISGNVLCFRKCSFFKNAQIS